MKRILALLLTLCLLSGCGLTGALAQETPTSLTVGTVTEMSGYFYTDLWGTNTSDMDVRGLIHGYGTIAWEREGNYALDSSVATALDTGLNATGDKIYIFTLADGLRWNNGTPITASDYLFTILLQSSPELAALGVSNANFEHLVGWEAFSQNSGAAFTGVRLLANNSFSLTVKRQYLPYFYELMLVNVQPTPMSVIAPGVTLADDGRGAYLTAGTAAFTTEMLQTTLVGENGYVFKPEVTCGAFSLTGYDGATHVANFTRNEYYKGNYEGQVSEITQLVFRPIQNATMLDELQKGTVDIVNKVSSGDVIVKGMQLVNEDKARTTTYMRSGFAFISFACEDATASDPTVRKAVAMAVDIDALCESVMSGYAMPVFGYYGLGQWMATQDTERLSALDRYGYDPNGAKQMLISDGWDYNQDGAKFVTGKDKLRYKIVDGALTPLDFRLAVTEASIATQTITDQLTAAAELFGARLTITKLEFPELLRHYYRQTDRTYNMFLLGTNFSHVYDPYFAFNTADEFQGVTNTTGLRDEKLMGLANEMRSVENNDVEGYLEKWYAFQEYFSEVMPIVPLYSNVYFDFVRPDLYNYQINAHWGWSSAILYATFTEPVVDLELAAVEATPAP